MDRRTFRGSAAGREHHRAVMDLGQNAIEAQSLNERLLNSCAMGFDPSALPQARELVLEFRAKLAHLAAQRPGGEVYQLSLQFFRLTEGIKSKGEEDV